MIILKFYSFDWCNRFWHYNLGMSVQMMPWRRSLQIFFTSSMPRTVSSAGSFWQRSLIWPNMVSLSFIRAQMTNGNPKRCLYSSLSRSMRDASPEPSASRPAAACSTRDSRVKVPRWRSLPARSGWHLRIPSLPVHHQWKDLGGVKCVAIT